MALIRKFEVCAGYERALTQVALSGLSVTVSAPSGRMAAQRSIEHSIESMHCIANCIARALVETEPLRGIELAIMECGASQIRRMHSTREHVAKDAIEC
eukprot:1046667-Amphidinium_carterae.1